CLQHYVDNYGRHQILPTKRHQLIETKARQSAPQPNIEKEKQDHFPEEIKDTQPRQLMYEWAIPTTEKQSGSQHRNGEHVDVFGQEEQRKLHGAVFSVKSGHELSFRFRKIERDAVRFSDGCNQVNKKAERLHPNQVPPRHAQVPAWRRADSLR